jgi:hypothetical protein
VAAVDRITVICTQCCQKLRLPRLAKALQVTCPRCRHGFRFRHYFLGFSSVDRQPALVGLAGALAGFAAVEVVNAALHGTTLDHIPTLYSMLTFAAFGICLGTLMGGAEGLFAKNRARLLYGLKMGALLGVISGAVAGAVAQVIYSTILGNASGLPSPGLIIFARAAGWAVLGLLLGASYGIKENTFGDLKAGLIGGGLGGLIGGLLFDPLGNWLQIGDGTISRLAAFLVLGAAIALAISRLREAGIRGERREMYRTLLPALPENPRLRLGPPTKG